jgi:hypothetical protein
MSAHHIGSYVSVNPTEGPGAQDTAGRRDETSTMKDTPSGLTPGTDRYEIRLRGHLDSRWAVWFDGMTLTTRSDGTTVIAGPVVDQAALHGLLHRLRDIGLPLVSVALVEVDQRECPPPQPDNAHLGELP